MLKIRLRQKNPITVKGLPSSVTHCIYSTSEKQPALYPAQTTSKPSVFWVRLRISAQKLVLISSKVARIYVNVSDRRVLTRLTIGPILTLRALKEWKSGSDVKAAFFRNRKILSENIPWRPERVCKHIPTGSGQSLIFQCLLRCRCIVHLKQVITNGETTGTKDITLQFKDSLISRKAKWTESDAFNPSLCRLSPFHLPYVKAMSLVGI